MYEQWGELRSAIHAGNWFEVSQFFWQADHPQRELMRKYILDHMDQRKSHVVIEMFGKVFKKIHFSEIPFERIRNEFHYETTDGHYFSCKPGDVALLMEAADGSLFIFAIDTDQWYLRFDVTQCVDICGDLEDLVDSPILRADVLMSDVQSNLVVDSQDEFQKWTFYHFATQKGYVTIRWLDHAEGRSEVYSRSAKVFVFEPDLYELCDV